MMTLPQLVAAEKILSPAPVWTEPDAAGYVRCYVPLTVGGITEAGLIFSGGAYSIAPERHVVFELSILGHDAKRRIRLSRVEWRSLTGGHSNRKCSGPQRNKPVPATHVHLFEHNWVQLEGRMRKGNLPCASAISQELQSFESFRAYTGTLFNIKNIDIVPPPPWVYDLFP